MKILVMRYRFIGDTLLMVPLLRLLRQTYPDAVIDVVVKKDSEMVLRHCPYVNNLLSWHDPTTGKSCSFWQMLQRIRANRYDMALVLKRSFSSAALAFLAGIPKRVGFNTEARGWMLTRRVRYAMDRQEVDCFFDLAEAAGIPVDWDSPELRRLEAWWPDEVTQTIADRFDEYVAQARPNEAVCHIAMHLNPSMPEKAWPIASFAECVDRLLSAQPDSMIHLVGASADSALSDELLALVSEASRGKIINWTGQTSLLETLALLQHMDVLVGADSGPLHMAAAVGTPVIALFGPMSPVKWHPLTEHVTIITENLPCRPCHLKPTCGTSYHCMTQITAERVTQACLTQLKRWRRKTRFGTSRRASSL